MQVMLGFGVLVTTEPFNELPLPAKTYHHRNP